MAANDASAGSWSTRIVAGALIGALLAAGFAVDPSVAAAFDAPKRLLVALAVGVATIAALVGASPWRSARSMSRVAGVAWAAAAACVLWSVLASWRAATPDAAFDQLRWMLLLCTAAVVGASPAMRGHARRHVAMAALIAVLGNALWSLSQVAGFGPEFTIAGTGGRFDTGALLGNEGYVSLACALLATATCMFAATASAHRGARLLAIAVAALLVATMLANQQRTSLIAWLLATAVLLLAHHRPAWVRATVSAVAAVFLVGVVALMSFWRPTSGPAPFDAERIAQLEQVTTYRVGAWAAALQMIETRPWFGYGPGSYARQSQVHRHAVESAWRQRLSVPPTATMFTQAHQDYLQLGAECGLPALVAVLILMLALGHGLLDLMTRSEAAIRTEASILLAVLVTGAISALAWFPLQIPLTALLLLLAAGRAWRLIADMEVAP